MSTLSEAMQEMFNRKNCPFLDDCDVPVTKDFFIRVCKRPCYPTCNHFARRVDELHTPISWIQKLAINQAKIMNENIETSQS